MLRYFKKKKMSKQEKYDKEFMKNVEKIMKSLESE